MPFTEYHRLDFNDPVVRARIANFKTHVISRIEEEGPIYISSSDFARICGTGRTNAALHSCLVKVKNTNGRRFPDGSPRPCQWSIHEDNWNTLMEIFRGFMLMRKKGTEVRDPIAKELIDDIQQKRSAADAARVIQH